MHLRLLTAVGAVAAAFQFALPAPVSAQDVEGVRIGLVYDPSAKPGIVVLPVAGPQGDSIRTMLQRDFTYGNRINVIGAFSTAADAPPGPDGRPNYQLYGRLGATGLVQASLTPSGALKVDVHDVNRQNVARSRLFQLAASPLSSEWRMSVHAVADEIEAWVTGVRGIAATRIAYTSNGRIRIVDSDGQVVNTVAADGIALSPSWHPTGRFVAFGLLQDDGSRIVIHDLQAGTSRVHPHTTRGTNMVPVFSPDGSNMAYAVADDGGTDLFLTPAFAAGPARRLTVSRGRISTSPTFSPDGRRIAFTTDRVGNPEVYVSGIDGANPEQLTPFQFGDQNYRSNPSWSPDNQSVSFQSRIDGRFQIVVLSLRDRRVRQVTSDGQNEDPSWAPDGRHLVFTSTRGGTRQLWIMDTESGATRQLTRDAGARLSSWSGHLGGRYTAAPQTGGGN